MYNNNILCEFFNFLIIITLISHVLILLNITLISHLLVFFNIYDIYLTCV